VVGAVVAVGRAWDLILYGTAFLPARENWITRHSPIADPPIRDGAARREAWRCHILDHFLRRDDGPNYVTDPLFRSRPAGVTTETTVEQMRCSATLDEVGQRDQREP
jgi:hypothetical protein